MHLVESVASVSQLPPRIQEYLADDTLRRPKMAFPTPLARMRSQSKLLESDNQSILNALYTLQAHQTCSTALFGNIICGFKLSVALGCDYKDVILDPEPLNRLHPTHDFDVATNLLNLASLSHYDCTQYVCSQIVHLLNTGPEDGKFVLWSCDLESEFNCILDLTGCPLLLGNLLMASDLPLTETSQPMAYRQVVEGLILAHSSYTRVCHMEGITSVLNISRSLVNRLLDCCQWPLMVRLLTGIGRYNEMNYIFQILRDNDQFEYLLGKGLDKQPQLMSATLEFVRRDKELFSLVAHHFSMYSELGALYEDEARAELGRLLLGDVVGGVTDLIVCPHNTTCLQTAMSKYTDATEHYMQAKKMNCAVSSMQQAELIMVQLSMLSNTSAATSVPCLVNLTKSQALMLVNTVLNCEQAHVVASAYAVALDWSAALYQHCVLKGNSEYLQDWTRHHQLTKTLVLDIVHRFQSEKEINAVMEGNMKLFISSVSLLDVKYRVASQLGFKDILQNLLASPDMAYLKDTVWQSGFKKQVF
ncbi:spatacsin [Homalodisca vitripennis]|uniref:spatacsin n=1 Tax=Homalodisca vitripennis TaxID=197043 RepID=UPI001EEC3DDF|nr:spatacsin [Homalodisca vitripennis]